MRNYTPLFLLVLQFLLSPSLVLPEEEAAEALWETSLGDKEVDLYAQGSWELSLLGGGARFWGDGGVSGPALFPGLTSGYAFQQSPDITLSLYLMEQYFLEASFTEGWDRNTYLLGYNALPESEDLLRRVRAGNTGISMEAYASQPLPEPAFNAPGLSARLETESSRHEFMARYDSSASRQKVYIGSREVTESSLDPAGWIRGQAFLLPDTGWDEGTLRVYRGSPKEGYGELPPSGYSFSRTDGTLTLAQPAKTRLLVYYEKGGLSIGHSTLGGDFIIPLDGRNRPAPEAARTDYNTAAAGSSAYNPMGTAVAHDGRDPVLLYIPGRYSPFERASLYPGIAQADYEVRLRSTGTSAAGTDLSDREWTVREAETAGAVHFRPAGTALRSAAGRYPFLEEAPSLYGLSPGRLQEEPPLTITEIQTSPAESYRLGPEVIPGSVTVYRNGLAETAWQLKPGTGEILFSRPIYPGDRLVIQYRTSAEEAAGGDLVLAQGNRFPISPDADGEGLLLFQWNMLPGQYSLPGEQRPGRLSAAFQANTPPRPKTDSSAEEAPAEEAPAEEAPAGEASAGETPFEGSLLLQGEIRSPNTTGTLRLAGMEGEALTLSPRRRKLFTEGALAQAGDAPPEVIDSSRGPLLTLPYSLSTGETGTAGWEFFSDGGARDLSPMAALEFQWRAESGSDIPETLTLITGETGGDEEASWTIDTADSRISPPDTGWSTVRIPLTRTERARLSRAEAFRLRLDAGGSPAEGTLQITGLRWRGSPFAGRITDGAGSFDGKLRLTETTEEDSPYSAAAPLEERYPAVQRLFHPRGETQTVLQAAWDSLAADGGTLLLEQTLDAAPPNSCQTLRLYLCPHSLPSPGTLTLTLGDPLNAGVTVQVPADAVTAAGPGRWQEWTIDLAEETLTIRSASGRTRAGTVTVDPDAPLSWSRLALSLTNSHTNSHTGALWVDEIHLTDPVLDGRLLTRGRFSWDGGGPLSLQGMTQFQAARPLNGPAPETALTNTTQLEGTLTAPWMGLSALYGHRLSAADGFSILRGSHTLSLPGPEHPESPLALEDSYSRSCGNRPAMDRTNTLTAAAGPQSLTLEGQASLEPPPPGRGQTDPGKLQQSWKLTHTSELGPWELSGDHTYRRALPPEAPFSRGSYPADWAADLLRILPRNDPAAEERSWESKLPLERTGPALSLQLTPSLSWGQDRASPAVRTAQAAAELRLPWKPFPENPGLLGTVTPSLQRRWESREPLDSETPSPEELSFPSGWTLLGRRLDQTLPLFRLPPLWDLFDPALQGRFREGPAAALPEGGNTSGTYTTAAGLALERPPASRLSAWILPAEAATRLSRTLSRRGGSLIDARRWETSLRFHPINLFGRRGAYPLIPWAETDEYSHSWKLTLSGEDPVEDGNAGTAPLAPETLLQQSFFQLTGDRGREITWENRTEWSWPEERITEDIRAVFRWVIIPEKPLSLPYTPPEIEEESYFSHHETAEASWTIPWPHPPFTGDIQTEAENGNSAEATPESVLSTLLLLSHETRLEMGDRGFLSGRLSAGWERLPEEWSLGWEAAITLTVTF